MPPVTLAIRSRPVLRGQAAHSDARPALRATHPTDRRLAAQVQRRRVLAERLLVPIGAPRGTPTRVAIASHRPSRGPGDRRDPRASSAGTAARLVAPHGKSIVDSRYGRDW